MQIAIDDIRTDGGTQPRAMYHYGMVDAYAEDMQAGAAFPPVVVFYDGTNYWLADGFHRILAAIKLERETIDTEVRQGTLADAQWYSYGVNKAHGLRRTNEDKERAVKAALLHPAAAGKSDHVIAEHCGVSQPYVSKLRSVDNGFQQGTRTGRDGKQYRASKPRAPRAATPAQESTSTPLPAAAPDPEPEPDEDRPAVPQRLADEVARLRRTYTYADLLIILDLLTDVVGAQV